MYLQLVHTRLLVILCIYVLFVVECMQIVMVYSKQAQRNASSTQAKAKTLTIFSICYPLSWHLGMLFSAHNNAYYAGPTFLQRILPYRIQTTTLFSPPHKNGLGTRLNTALDVVVLAFRSSNLNFILLEDALNQPHH